MKVRLTLFVVCTLALTSAAFAQTLTIGPNPATTNGGAGTIALETVIDLTTPANANGTATSARFGWAASVCPNAVKIKFFHRSGNTLTFYDERGPFTVTTSPMTVTLTPPVNVQVGDLIGIAELTPCGNAEGLFGTGASAGFVYFSGDLTGSTAISSGTTFPNALLSIGGSGLAISGPTIPALSPVALALLALGFALTGFVVLRR
jgi:hypothetical protein